MQSIALMSLLAATLVTGAAAFFGSAPPAVLPNLPPEPLDITDGHPRATKVARKDEVTGELLAEASPYEFHSVQLQKQYVPISKNDKVIAYKTAYFGRVYLGSDQSQSFTVVFDTGSGHVILPSTNCPSETCKKHRRYNRRSSPSAVDIEYDGRPLNKSATERDQVAIAFGTGQVLGEFVKEYVCLGPSPSSCVTLRVVLALDMTTDPFGLFAFDGVFGLGLNALTLSPHYSFFSQMIAQRPEMPARFSVFLGRTDNDSSIISFGGHDERLAGSAFQHVPVAKPELGFWQVQIKSIRIGGQVLDECEDGECRAILDTGTSLLGVPRVVTSSMHRRLARPVPKELQQSSQTGIDCRTIPGLRVDFDLGDAVVSIDVEDYSRPTPVNMTTNQSTAGSPLAVASGILSQEPSWKLLCRSLLLPVDQEAPIGPKVFIWGEPVLRRYMTVYDLEKKTIGFATAGQGPLRSSSTKLNDIDVPAAPVNSLLPGAPLPIISKPAEGNSTQQVVEI